MNEQIVALSVDKIQTFLTEVIDSHVQEKQTEDGTLRKIIDSSYQISKGFFESIKSIFPESDKEVLLECSGVYIFRCTLSKLELEKRLNSLFTDYYRESQGQKLIRWVHFPSGVMNDIDAIKKAKKCLKQSKCWNKTLEKNQGLIFSFCLVQKEEDEKSSTLKLFISKRCPFAMPGGWNQNYGKSFISFIDSGSIIALQNGVEQARKRVLSSFNKDRDIVFGRKYRVFNYIKVSK